MNMLKIKKIELKTFEQRYVCVKCKRISMFGILEKDIMCSYCKSKDLHPVKRPM